ncbi:hypothetical protein F0U60_40045 [Archangium minus]|uniref:DUF4935 domain-containing protein n=1 Tax=Archangium minus TaxID=83450 RepID=A0ABY9X2L3_9BACT|nr:hypothetical protein F0U60_40045 [Archangium minus]
MTEPKNKKNEGDIVGAVAKANPGVVHVILDTSALRKEVSPGSGALQRLQELVDKHVVEVLVPELVPRELATQLAAEWKKWQHKGEKDPQKVLSWCIPGEMTTKAESALGHVSEFSEQVEKLLVDGVDQRLRALRARFLHLSEASTRAAWDMYFKGDGPMKQAKSREDIPDAFIVAAALEEQSRLGKILHLVSADERMRKSMPKDRFVGHETLSAFNTSQDIRDALKAAEPPAADELPEPPTEAHWREHVQEAISQQMDSVQSGVEDSLWGALQGKSVTAGHLPSEDNSAELTGDGSIEELNLDLGAMDDLGHEAVLVPATLTIVDALADFFAFKADFWASEEDEGTHFSVSEGDWNDHYLAAQAYLTLKVKALIRVDLEYDENKEPIVATALIENIESIEVQEPEWWTKKMASRRRVKK